MVDCLDIRPGSSTINKIISVNGPCPQGTLPTFTGQGVNTTPASIQAAGNNVPTIASNTATEAANSAAGPYLQTLEKNITNPAFWKSVAIVGVAILLIMVGSVLMLGATIRAGPATVSNAPIRSSR